MTAAFLVEGLKMSWKKPRIVEISVGMEINAYACATL
jgi:coenzyme PQQ precursor peptide PqqA